MFKFITKLFFISILTCLISCNNSDDTANLEIEAQIGELENFVNFKEGEVVLTASKVGEIYIITSSLAMEVNKAVACNNPFGFSFTPTVLDKNHLVIVELEDFDFESQMNWDTNVSYLTRGTLRTQLKMEYSAVEWEAEMKSKWEIIKKEGVYIQLVPATYAPEYTEYKSTSNEKEDMPEEIDDNDASEEESNNDNDNGGIATYSSTSSNGSSSSSSDASTIVEDNDTEYGGNVQEEKTTDINDEATETRKEEKSNTQVNEKQGKNAKSKEFDESLDLLEEYVDDYINYMEKVADGEANIGQAQAMLGKAQKMVNKMNHSKSEMSALQVARFLKIEGKLAAASIKMSLK